MEIMFIMNKILLVVSLLAVSIISNAQYMGKGNLPPVFSHEVMKKTQFENRTRAFMSPTRILWMQNAELIEGANNLFLPGNGQASLSVAHKCIFRSKEGKRPSILLDFGHELQGGIQIVTCFRNQKEAKVRIRLGESVSEAMSNITPESGATNDHAMRDFIIDLPWLGVIEVGNSGFRFVRIDLLDDDMVLPIKEIRAYLAYRDIPYLGSFRSSNQRLDSIWMTGAYTLHLNLQEFLFEGAKRDRMVWLGDLHPEVKTALVVFGDNEAIQRSLDLARDETKLPEWMNGVISYSLWWIMIHQDYYMYHGNLNYLKEQQEYLSQLLRILIESIDENGNENLKNGGRFLDWPSSKNKKAIDAGYQSLLMISLKAGEALMTVLGDKALASECSTTVMKMAKIIPDYTASKQSAALAAMSGVVAPHKIDKEVISVGGARDFSTFYGYYMLVAKALAENYQGAIDDICNYWGGMLDLGATTFWEDFDLKWLENANRIDEMPQKEKVDIHATYGDYCYKGLRHSFCHGWASGPTAWLSEYVLGVSIIEPGCKVVKIKPNLGNLEWVEGSFPTPYGLIKIRHEKISNGSIKSKIDAPKQVRIIR